ncbi:DUF4349 domain-containing protein [Lysobacter xanthus]
MIRPAPLAAALAVALSLAACSRGQPTANAGTDSVAEERTAVAAAPAAAPPPEAPALQKAAGTANVADASVDASATVTGPGVTADAMGSATLTQDAGTRRFIRTAQVDGHVRDVQRAATHIEDFAARFGGFVTLNALSTSTGRVERRSLGDGRLVELSTYVVEGRLQVRVPSDRAQAFLRAIAPELDFLDRRHFEAVDAQFDLLRRELARLRHDRAQAALGAVSGGKAADQADIIDRRAQQQAERDEAAVEQRGFEDRVEFATLDLTLRQPERVRRAERPDVEAILRNERPGLGTRLGHAIADGGRAMLDVLVALVALWPLLLVTALAALALRAWRRRR